MNPKHWRLDMKFKRVTQWNLENYKIKSYKIKSNQIIKIKRELEINISLFTNFINKGNKSHVKIELKINILLLVNLLNIGNKLLNQIYWIK